MATITSSCPAGTVIVMNSFIDPSNTEKYLELTKPVAAEFRKHPENLFTAVSVNPTDPGHIRIVHGWTKDSAWFAEVISTLDFESRY
jgi:quinol monooxygenase YgiN